MKVQIRQYRGVERADIELDPIALVAGRNGAGKSSVAQAVAAALTSMAIVVPGVSKKDAKKLVRDGADEGAVLLTQDTVSRSVSYPKAEVSGLNDADFGSSELAVGLGHIFDMKPDDRARVLAGYIQAMPTKSDIVAAVGDIGYNETTAARVWAAVEGGTPDAWDQTWAKSREYGTKEKGKWEGITGEAYGSKKAADWKPVALTNETDRQVLADKVLSAKQRVERTVGSAAVSEAEIARLNKLVEAAAGAEDITPVKADLEKVRGDLAKARTAREAMPSEAQGSGTKNEQRPCPACGAALVIEKVYNEPIKLSVFSSETAAAAAKHDNRKDRAKLDGTIAGLKSAVVILEGRYEMAKRLTDDGMAAAERLTEIGENKGAGQDAIFDAKAALNAASLVLQSFDNKAKADELHAAIAKNEQLIALLAPDGLRRRTLAKALGAFNGLLAELSAAAGWPAVRLDESLAAHYGQRPVGSVSKSEQWRARAVVQIAMASLDGSVAVVIDDAETMIDAKSRSGLFSVLQKTGLRALVCMAFAKRELVPNLAAAGLGASYWIENAVAEVMK